MAHKQPFGIVDIVLIIGILALTAGLVMTIYLPGQKMAEEENFKWQARNRMSLLRTAENQYFSVNRRYARDIDSLISFVRDSIPAGLRDSLFNKSANESFTYESMRISPKSGKPFILAVCDTAAIPRYQITDPDGFGYVSSLSNPDEHNKASWEQ